MGPCASVLHTVMVMVMVIKWPGAGLVNVLTLPSESSFAAE